MAEILKPALLNAAPENTAKPAARKHRGKRRKSPWVRAEERWLLFCSLAIVGAGGWVLRERGPGLWLGLAVLGAGAVAAHILLRIGKCGGPNGYLPGITLLTGLGWLLRVSLGPPQGPVASVLPGVALVAFAGGALAFRRWGEWIEEGWWVTYGLTLALTGGMAVLGAAFRGGLYGPGMTTPQEAAKLLFPCFLAVVFTRYREAAARSLGLFPGWGFAGKQVWVPIVFVGIPGLAFVVVRDLGLAALFLAVALVMVIEASKEYGYLLYPGTLIALATAFPQYWPGHAAGRIQAWLDPWTEVEGAGWQVAHGLSAVNAGALWGQGLGKGLPGSIPLAATDFIFPAAGEELGWLGTVMVLMIFGGLLKTGAGIAATQKQPFRRNLAAGFTALLAVQVFLNIGGIFRVVPLTGIVLPWLSQGGTALLTFSVMMGVVQGMGGRRLAR